MRKREKVLEVMVGFCIALLGLVLLMRVSELISQVKKNNTFVQGIACTTSVGPTVRTPEYKNSCYDEAEKDNGYKVKRFGDLK